jgi:hypothetical protein
MINYHKLLDTSLQLHNADSVCTITPIPHHSCWFHHGVGYRPHIFVANNARRHGSTCPWGGLGHGRFLGLANSLERFAKDTVEWW